MSISSKKILGLALVVVVVFFTYMPSLGNGYTNWDDGTLLKNNPQVRSLSAKNIVNIFNPRKLLLRTYIPLTTLSFAVEYHFFKINPFIYHLDSLFLHLGVTCLVFFLSLRMGVGLPAAVFVSLLFGIHPAHTEPVAWIAGRKDVLYAFFYMLSIMDYWSYLESSKRKHYIMSVAWALLSILSKPMAFSLPVVLFIFDWMHKRKPCFKLIKDKIPYVLAVVPFAWITFSNFASTPGTGVHRSVLVWVWTFVFYIRQFFTPIILSPSYEMPEPISLSNSAYAVSTALMALFIAIVFLLRRNKWFVFAVCFYFLSIFPLLRFDLVYGLRNLSFVADRFSYLPSMGFCFFTGASFYEAWRKAGQGVNIRKAAIIFFIAVVLAGFCVKTYSYSMVWKNTSTLWTYVVGIFPRTAFAYVNRGLFSGENGKIDAALKDFNTAIALDPVNFPEAYNSRGNVFMKLGRYDDALKDYDTAVRLRPNFAEAYYNRANYYRRIMDYDAALLDYDRTLKLNGVFPGAYLYRSAINAKNKKYHKALDDALKARQLGIMGIDGYIVKLRAILGSLDEVKSLR